MRLAAASAVLAEGTTAAAEVVLGLAVGLGSKVGNLVAAALLVGALLAAEAAERLVVVV